MQQLNNVHPGEILLEEFLNPFNLNVNDLSNAIYIKEQILSQIISYQSSITADIAWRLSKYFGTTPQFWLGLQNDYDLEEAFRKDKKAFNQIRELAKNS